jgi:hypothetical protein
VIFLAERDLWREAQGLDRVDKRGAKTVVPAGKDAEIEAIKRELAARKAAREAIANRPSFFARIFGFGRKKKAVVVKRR